MPYKNDNLEELFQNAANDYPLRTDNSNWDSVSAKLQPAVTNAATGKNRSLLRYAALLVLLLGGSLLCLKFQPVNTNSNLQKANTTSINTQKQTLAPLDKRSPVKANTGKTLNGKNDFTLNDFNYNSEKYKAAVSKNNFSISENNNQSPNVLNNNPDNSYSALQANSGRTSSIENSDQKTPNNLIGDNNNENVAASQNINQSATNSKASRKINQVVKFNPTLSRFYGTLYASPEFSMVKFQQISKPGYKIGVALGYRINSRLSVELGLQREHINYYTDGKYFDKSGLRLKEAVSLESVTASSKLTSVPLTLKYNFAIKNNSHFFTAVGANMVALTHTENYEYLVSKNGSENDLTRSFGSVTSPKYFTCINVSGGYETKLFNHYNFDIEPYYQIPIRSTGIGKLPVTSFGVNIGIIRDLK